MNLFRPTHIVIHHSLTKDSQTVSWGAIRHYHTKVLGWRDIGYHVGLEDINGYPEILLGRMLGERGAHTSQDGMNSKSLGICVVGNYDSDLLDDVKFKKLVALCGSLMWQFDVPAERVHAHREFATYKSCPGTRFPWERFKNSISHL